MSWFQPIPSTSLRLLNDWADPNGSIIDVGAGVSTLVDSHLIGGWQDVTVLDISGAALAKVRHRLGAGPHSVGYVAIASQAINPDGILLLATFGADGPTQCLGLPANRYNPEELAILFDDEFTLEYSQIEDHTTPSGAKQSFAWVVLRHK